MSNPYQPPSAKPLHGEQSKRVAHSLTALVSGLVVPPTTVFLTTSFLFPDVPLGQGNSAFWGEIVLGSMLAAAAVYRHKRIPMWLAAITGPATVLTLALAPILWTEVLVAQ